MSGKAIQSEEAYLPELQALRRHGVKCGSMTFEWLFQTSHGAVGYECCKCNRKFLLDALGNAVVATTGSEMN